MISGNLGPKETREMEAAGWRFSARGIELGNCWAVWANDPQGNSRLVFLADPEKELEKFAASSSTDPGDEGQLELFGNTVPTDRLA